MATVAMALLRLGTSSSWPATSAAASATLGVSTAARTTSLGLGTSTAASALGGMHVVSGTPECLGRVEQSRLVGFGVDRGEFADGPGGQARVVQRRTDQLEDLLGADPAARADADRQAGRSQHD